MKLKLSQIRSLPNSKINKGLWIGYLKSIAEQKHGKIDFNVFLPSKGVNLQRPFVWNLLQKQQLILSLLKGINIPHLSIIIYHPNEKEKVLKIIDGKQRLSTLISFLQNEFSIEWENQFYYFNDLDEKAQREISLFGIQADIMYEYWDDLISDEDKILWFEQINFLGTVQDVEHLKSLK